MSEVVLDASALLALLNAEPGSDVVAEELPNGVISSVNLSEVVAKLAEKGMPEAAVRSALAPLALDVRIFDTDAAWAAGFMRVETRAHGLSLGDRSCLALGKRLQAPVLTADRRWKAVKVGVAVRVVR